jgi:hypothetical protein
MVRLVADTPERCLAGDDVVEASAPSIVALAAELRRAFALCDGGLPASLQPS